MNAETKTKCTRCNKLCDCSQFKMKKNGKLNTVCDACCDKKRPAYQMNPSRNAEPDYKNTEFEELPDLICVNCFEGHLIGDAKVEFAFQFRIPDAWLEDTVMQIANSLWICVETIVVAIPLTYIR